MEADLYDEFGNYIGPELESDEESEEEEEADEEDAIEYVSEVVLIDPQRNRLEWNRELFFWLACLWNAVETLVKRRSHGPFL